MSSDLKHKTLHAAKWSAMEAVYLRGTQFVIGIILSRLLSPEQFGLIGMLTFFIAVSESMVDSGFGAALIQRPVITEKDTSSIFYFNILVAVIAAGCLCGVAPWVADFYKQPVLTSLLRVLSMVLVINAFGLVQNLLFVKAIDFKTQTKVSLIASVLSGSIGIGMAYMGFGVWSLVVQQLSIATFRTILFWMFSHWRPAWLFSLKSLREMFGFGSKLLASGLLNTIFDNIYLVTIGKLFSPANLGYYTRASNLQHMPSFTLSTIVSRVSFPVFSSIQQDTERVKRGMKKALTMLALVNFPLMIGLGVVARPLVLVLLTDKWLPCVPYLQLLCMVGMVFPLQGINLNIPQSLGRSDIVLGVEMAKKMLVVLNIAITYRWGILAMIEGQVITSFVSYYLSAYYNKALLNYSFWEQLGDIYPYFINSIMMGGAVYALTYLPISSNVILLFCQVATGGIVYVILCRLFSLTTYMELQGMVLRRLIGSQDSN